MCCTYIRIYRIWCCCGCRIQYDVRVTCMHCCRLSPPWSNPMYKSSTSSVSDVVLIVLWPELGCEESARTLSVLDGDGNLYTRNTDPRPSAYTWFVFSARRHPAHPINSVRADPSILREIKALLILIVYTCQNIPHYAQVVCPQMGPQSTKIYPSLIPSVFFYSTINSTQKYVTNSKCFWLNQLSKISLALLYGNCCTKKTSLTNSKCFDSTSTRKNIPL